MLIWCLKISLGSFHVFYVWKKTRQKNPINDVHPKLNPNTLFLDKYKYGLLLMWFFRNDRWFQIKTAKKNRNVHFLLRLCVFRFRELPFPRFTWIGPHKFHICVFYFYSSISADFFFFLYFHLFSTHFLHFVLYYWSVIPNDLIKSI